MVMKSELKSISEISIELEISKTEYKNMGYSIKQTQIRTQTFRKSGPWNFRKSGHYIRIHFMI